MPDAEVAKSEAGKIQPFEVIASTALAGLASLIPDPAFRSIAALLAPPMGYGFVWLGRSWFADWKKDEPIRRAKKYIKEAEKERRNNMSPAESRRLEARIKDLQEVLHKLQLNQVELVQLPPPSAPQP